MAVAIPDRPRVGVFTSTLVGSPVAATRFARLNRTLSAAAIQLVALKGVTHGSAHARQYSHIRRLMVRAAEAASLDAKHRLRLHLGPSNATVPWYAAAAPSSYCDVISIDGGHGIGMAAADLANTAALSRPDGCTVGLIDDTPFSLDATPPERPGSWVVHNHSERVRAMRGRGKVFPAYARWPMLEYAAAERRGEVATLANLGSMLDSRTMRETHEGCCPRGLTLFTFKH